MSSVTIRRPRVLLAALALIAALGIAALRVSTLSDIGGFRLSANWALIDFQSTIYYPVRALVDGVNPYDRASYRARYRRTPGLLEKAAVRWGCSGFSHSCRQTT